jgi:hypothetical protein
MKTKALAMFAALFLSGCWLAVAHYVTKDRPPPPQAATDAGTP